jgi:hypothetical protein
MWNALREINQKETAVCGPHNVSWLEVAMKNAGKVKLLHQCKYLIAF